MGSSVSGVVSMTDTLLVLINTSLLAMDLLM
jgi:hypothetical protein